MLLMTRGVEVMSLDFPDAKVLVVRPNITLLRLACIVLFGLGCSLVLRFIIAFAERVH